MSKLSHNLNKDKFVISRQSACPELIFNREYETDRYTRGTLRRYFDLEQPIKWKFSDKHAACPVCHRYTYTLIFFNRDFNQNEDLIEIHDANMLKKIKNDNRLQSLGSSDQHVPLICGTVVPTDHHLKSIEKNNAFNRKLAMMRADLYTLLSISQTAKIVGR